MPVGLGTRGCVPGRIQSCWWCWMPREAMGCGFWGRTSGFIRFLLPLQALRCTGSWGQGFGDPASGPAAARAAWGAPWEMWGSRTGSQLSQTSPKSFPSREDFPFPPWLPFLLLSTWLPLFLLFLFYFFSLIHHYKWKTRTCCLGWGVSLGSPLGMGTSAVLADNWTFPAVCCCCGFHFIVLRWFFCHANGIPRGGFFPLINSVGPSPLYLAPCLGPPSFYGDGVEVTRRKKGFLGFKGIQKM